MTEAEHAAARQQPTPGTIAIEPPGAPRPARIERDTRDRPATHPTPRAKPSEAD